MSLFSSFDTKLFFFSIFLFIVLMIQPQEKSSNISLIKIFYFKFSSSLLVMVSMNSFLVPKGLSSFLYCLFFYLVMINAFSIFPFIFPMSSQAWSPLTFSFPFWSSLTLFYILHNYKMYFSHLVPQSSPVSISWFVFLVEFVSSFIRPVTLGMRLVANILSGHVLIILTTNYFLESSNFFLGPLVLYLVELCVALIQGFIFVLMMSLYSDDLRYW